MDSLTQITLGAAVGQLGFQKQLGRRAIVWGGIAGFLPDLDVLVRLSSDPYAEMLYHRGVTHSLFFAPVAGPILGYLLWRYYGSESDKLRSWIYLMIAALITHPLLDVFTTYGTQLLAPFSHHRFVISSIAIVDPLYTVPLMFSILVGLIFPKRLTLSSIASGLTMLWSVVYLFMGLQIHDVTLDRVQNTLAQKNIPVEKIFVHPTFLQLPLRRVTIHLKNEVWVGFTSFFANRTLTYQRFKKAPKKLLTHLDQTRDMSIFKWFTGGDYFAEMQDINTLMVYDARYGMPGDQGLWGLKVQVDAQGHVMAPLERAGLNRAKVIKKLAKLEQILVLALYGDKGSGSPYEELSLLD